jgi:hypothetical protein
MSKTVSVALKAHLALGGGGCSTIRTCAKVTLTNGTVKGFTNHDANLVISGVTYLSGSYTLAAIDTSSALNVDNTELAGVLRTPAITEVELMSGIWDYAAVEIFSVNYKDLTMGTLELRTGTLGEVSEGRNEFHADIRGKMQSYQQQFGRLYGVECDADLGDARCKVDLGVLGDSPPGLTVGGTVSAVTNRHVFTDSSRTESTAAVAATITGITKALPGVVTAIAHGFSNRQSIGITGVVGMTQVNGGIYSVIVVDADHFQINVDTTNNSTYTSGGTATLVDTGYFGYGVLTWLTGANAGRTEDVRLYQNGGIFTLALPMGYDIAIGDTYSVTPGCDKQISTCRTKFNNVVNFRGFPKVPGSDKLYEVGTQNNAVTA